MNRKWLYTGVGSFLVTVVLLLTILFPVFDKRSIWSMITEKEEKISAVSDSWVDGDWFYDIPMSRNYGGISFVGVNYTRFWSDLNKHVKWNLLYNNGVSWVNASSKMNIYVVNRKAGNQKFAMNFTPLQSGSYRLQLFIDWKNMVSYDLNDASGSYLLSYKTGNRSWGFSFNYGDIRNTAGLNFNKVMNKKDQLVFNVTCVIPVDGVGKKISLDPSYGVIADAAVSSLEWDTNNGRKPDMVRVGSSQFYLISANGPDSSSGSIYSIKIWDSNGTIKSSIVDSYLLVNNRMESSSIVPVTTNIYAVAYRDILYDRVNVSTVTVSDTTGAITKSRIDTTVLSQDGVDVDMIHVNGNVYIVAYREAGTAPALATNDGFMETVWINASGTINNTYLSRLEFDKTYSRFPDMISIDSDTIAIAYSNITYTPQLCYLKTYNISSSGAITASNASWWKFDTSGGNTPALYHIYGNVYVIARYYGTDADLYLGTCAITSTGAITKSWIDSLVVDTGGGYYPTIFSINNALSYSTGVYGISYQGASADGYVTTMNISSTGVIGDAIVDTMEFDTADTIYYTPVVYVANYFYLLVYEGTLNDGWSKTINIRTSITSALSIPSPVNNSGEVSTGPSCEITVNDINNDSLNVYWYENSTGGWVLRQTNSSVLNGTYRWSFTQASNMGVKYWWKVAVNDSRNNISSWYCFTTTSSTTSWHVIDSSVNGSFHNVSSFKIIDSSINGSIKNLTYWNIINESTDSIIIRPNANGSNTGLSRNAENSNYKCVDETAANSDTDYVYKTSGELYLTDVYNLTDHTSESGTITDVKVYAGCRMAFDCSATWYYMLTIRINNNYYNSSQSTVDNQSYFNKTNTWITNPNTGVAWTWADIDALQAGVSFKHSIVYDFDCGSFDVRCTQVYVLVNYMIYTDINGSIYNATAKTWGVIDSSINGSLYNQTHWGIVNSSINGSIYNNSSWKSINSSINGSIWNNSGIFHEVELLNGSIFNSSVSSWSLIDDTINGSIWNSSGIFREIDVLNGSLFNLSRWFIIDSTLNGTIYNLSIEPPWNIIDDTINGSIYNSSSVLSLPVLLVVLPHGKASRIIILFPCFILFIVILFFCLWYRRRKKNDEYI